MSAGRLRRRAALLALVLLVPLPGTPDVRADETKPCVRVMTWNLYVGADLSRAIEASTPEALAAATAEIFGVLQRTDFPQRAKAIAAQIAEEDPDVVALQEAALWLTGPPGDPAPADDVAYDFLQILLGELQALGAAYDVAASVDLFDTEVPAAPPVARDVRLVDRDAVLVRRGHIGVPGAGTFRTQLMFPGGFGQPITSTRGWLWVDLALAGSPVRVVATHLEAFDWQVRLAQAQELLAPDGAVGAATTGVILLGDLNTGPDLPVPDNRKAFAALTAAGFVDTWAVLHPGDPGYTAGFGELLDDPSASVLKHRVDHVMTLGGWTPAESRIVGTDPGDRTAGGMWPSDHAGVVASLRR
ncbi:MAG: endonuclease/exonuclease/phosphatase family protein [Actinomycetota bacterium]